MAAIAALYRYPVKGFSAERVDQARLAAGEAFPGDRLFAVEDGPSGFDPAAPAFVSKQRFTVLAKIAEVAQARTRWDAASGRLSAQAPGRGELSADLRAAEGKAAFAAWLGELLGEAATGPLRVIDGEGHRFLDHPQGHVSVLNLASVADLAARLERPVDPLRFRANIHIDGWPAWAENGWTGREMRLGGARARVFSAITRCAAPGVDPATALRDIDVTGALHRFYGHILCGIYVQVIAPGEVESGAVAEVLAQAPD